jgi:predicted Zn-dependent peptidase
MEQIEKLKKGEFDESMIASVINNYKKYQMSELENYTVAADKFVTSFIYEIPWANMVAELDNMAKVTKEEIVAAANKYFTNGYVSIFKEQGRLLRLLQSANLPLPLSLQTGTNRVIS